MILKGERYMKKQVKFFVTGLLSAAIIGSTSIIAFAEDAFPAYKAGSWQKDPKGWWYLNPDGSYPYNSWNWIDGNNDGIAEYYRFDEQGYLLTNQTTDEGVKVNSDGALYFETGVVTRKVPVYTDPSVNDFSRFAGTYYFYKSEGGEYINRDRLGGESAIIITVDGYKIYMQSINNGNLSLPQLMMWDDLAGQPENDTICIKYIPTSREVASTKTTYCFENGMFFIEKRGVYDYFKK